MCHCSVLGAPCLTRGRPSHLSVSRSINTEYEAEESTTKRQFTQQLKNAANAFKKLKHILQLISMVFWSARKCNPEGFLLGILLDVEGRCSVFLRNVGLFRSAPRYSPQVRTPLSLLCESRIQQHPVTHRLSKKFGTVIVIT
jgi:hypothetical protein